jgi:hypothetical protein
MYCILFKALTQAKAVMHSKVLATIAVNLTKQRHRVRWFHLANSFMVIMEYETCTPSFPHTIPVYSYCRSIKSYSSISCHFASICPTSQYFFIRLILYLSIYIVWFRIPNLINIDNETFLDLMISCKYISFLQDFANFNKGAQQYSFLDLRTCIWL